MKKLLLFPVIGLLLLSCSGEEERADLSKHLDFNPKTTITNPVEILETKYIKLETNDKALFGVVNQIESTDEYIFALDIRMGKLLVFDHNGRYVGEVGRKGRGPEEFIMPVSFIIDDKGGYIPIVDSQSRKINHYSLSNNFEFIYSLHEEFFISAMEVTNSGNLICYTKKSSSDYCFFVLDKDFEIINSFVYRDYMTGYQTGPTKPIYKSSGDIFGYTQYESVVYKLSETEATPFYTISFGENSIPPLSFYQEVIGENNSSHFKLLNESGYVSYFGIYEATEDLCISFIDNDGRYIGFWDKQTDKTYSYDENYFAEKMDIGAFSHVSGVVSDYFVASLNTDEIRAAQKDGVKINDRLAELVKDSKKGDNPILFMFKTK